MFCVYIGVDQEQDLDLQPFKVSETIVSKS